MDCVFLDEGYCSAAAIEVDPDSGCMTYSPSADAAAGDDWEEEEELEEWDEVDSEEDEDEEIWLDEDEEEY
jgi:hypothetical protein